jgi:23S rRNA (adenine2503-C2)-methyltransferase
VRASLCYDSNVDQPTSLYEMRRPELAAWVADLGQPRYRADQVWHWLYRRLAPSFDVMHTLPVAFRRHLADVARLHTLEPILSTRSEDGLAEKVLFRLADGQCVETVLMHYVDGADAADEAEPPAPAAGPGRHTVCLSTQVGCAMGCVFCATGQMGLLRDLTAGECVEQVVWCARRLARSGERVTNAVFMGMGEPLANWPATDATIDTLTDPDGLGLSARRVTVSTVGLVPGIRRLAAARRPVRLAVSLHAPDDALRAELVGIDATYDLDAILAACRHFQAIGGRRITFEYVLIRGVNDQPEQAARLAARLRGLGGHVNLIRLNPTRGSRLEPSSFPVVVAFQQALQTHGIPATIRLRRGIEIDAGCGQLRTRVLDGRVGRSVGRPAGARLEEGSLP